MSETYNTDEMGYNKKHFKLYEYWRDKYITEDGRVLDHYEEGAIDAVPNDAPSCWGCRKEIYHTEDYEKHTDEELWKLKKTSSRLQICHIKPKCLGGTLDVDNLFVLCADCHALSPDTLNREAFFRWIYKYRKSHYFGYDLFEVLNGVKEELKARNIEFDKAVIFADKNFKEYLDQTSNSMTSHGFKLQESTMIVGIADALEMAYRRGMLESAIANE